MLQRQRTPLHPLSECYHGSSKMQACCLWIQGMDASRSLMPGGILAGSPWWELRPSAAPGERKKAAPWWMTGSVPSCKHGHSSSRAGSLLDCSLPLLPHKEKRAYRLWGARGGWGRIRMFPRTNLAMGITYKFYMCVYMHKYIQTLLSSSKWTPLLQSCAAAFSW